MPVASPFVPLDPFRRLLPQRSLEDIFDKNEGRLIHKWVHYFDIYERHFTPLRYRSPRVLEIGVSHGGSLSMWKQWFGAGAHIIGVDIDPRVTALAGDGIDIRVGDQGDETFLDQLVAEDAPFDIVIDDGSHRPSDQLATLEKLWPVVNVGGVYLVEDLHANYWPEYGGDVRQPDTFVEFVKPLIDDLHAFHSRTEGFEPTRWTKTLGGVHIYDSIVVFDRVERTAPTHRKTGRPVFDSLYGESLDAGIDPEHQADIVEMNRLHRRALRAMRSPIASGRTFVDRLR